MPEVTTILSRVNRAKDFVESALQQDYWLAIGNISTPWENELMPPPLSPSLLELPELLGAVYINTVSLIAEDPSGSIYNNFARYKAYDLSASQNTLITKLATKVYLAAYLDSYKLPLGVSYRSIGLITNLQTSITTQRTKGFYVPANNIESYELLWMNTISPKRIDANVLEQIQLIMEF